jgi:hypothetical protein
MAQRQPIAMVLRRVRGSALDGRDGPQSNGVARRDADLAAEGTPLTEIEMLLHLPIAIIATLSPIAISDTVPKFDIARECRFESDSSNAVDRCARDEADARQQLETEWPQFVRADRSACLGEATIGGFASYVDLLICLEMARDARIADTDTPGSPGVRSTPPAPSELSVVDKHE